MKRNSLIALPIFLFSFLGVAYAGLRAKEMLFFHSQIEMLESYKATATIAAKDLDVLRQAHYSKEGYLLWESGKNLSAKHKLPIMAPTNEETFTMVGRDPLLEDPELEDYGPFRGLVYGLCENLLSGLIGPEFGGNKQNYVDGSVWDHPNLKPGSVIASYADLPGFKKIAACPGPRCVVHVAIFDRFSNCTDKGWPCDCFWYWDQNQGWDRVVAHREMCIWDPRREWDDLKKFGPLYVTIPPPSKLAPH